MGKRGTSTGANTEPMPFIRKFGTAENDDASSGDELDK